MPRPNRFEPPEHVPIGIEPVGTNQAPAPVVDRLETVEPESSEDRAPASPLQGAVMDGVSGGEGKDTKADPSTNPPGKKPQPQQQHHNDAENSLSDFDKLDTMPSAAILDKLNRDHPSTWFATCDVPDPDNFPMFLQLAKNFIASAIDGHLIINLSPRPVDFKAIPYGNVFGNLVDDFANVMPKGLSDTQVKAQKKADLQKIIGVMTQSEYGKAGVEDGWLTKLSSEDQSIFYVDGDFKNDNDVLQATKTYMEVSALRLHKVLDEHGISRDAYRINWDQASTNSFSPGIRHAKHGADWSWDLNDDQADRLKKAVATAKSTTTGEKRSSALRDTSLALAEAYITAELARTGIPRPSLLTNLDATIQSLQSTKIKVHAFVGGPFTETLKLHKAGVVKDAQAMAGYIKGEVNLFANQFNFLVDIASAHATLDAAQSGALDLTLMPTETIKNDIYKVPGSALKELTSPAGYKLITQYQPAMITQGTAKYPPFDWVMAPLKTQPHLFPLKTVKAIGDDVIKFDFESGESGIKMVQAEEELMTKYLSQYREAFKRLFQPLKPAKADG